MLSTDRRHIPTLEELKTTSEHKNFFYLTSQQTFTASPLLDAYSLLWKVFFGPVKASRPQESARIFPGGSLQNCQQPALFDLLSAAEKLRTASILLIFQLFKRNVCFSSAFFLFGIFGFVFVFVFSKGSCWHEAFFKKTTNPHFIFFNRITKLMSLFLKTLLLFWTMELAIPCCSLWRVYSKL